MAHAKPGPYEERDGTIEITPAPAPDVHWVRQGLEVAQFALILFLFIEVRRLKKGRAAAAANARHL